MADPIPPRDSTSSAGAVRAPVWPIILWSLQLVPCCAVLFWAWYRLQAPEPLGAARLGLISFAAAWALFAITFILSGRGRRWVRRRRLQILAATLSTGFSVLLVDVALTVFGVVPTIGDLQSRSLRYNLDVATRHRLLAGQVVVREGAEPVRINARGLRGPEVPASKDRDESRVVVLGGSQVFDFDGGNWPVRAGELLRASGLTVSVLNAGVPSHCSADSLAKLQFDLWLLQPEVVVVVNGWNDLKYFPDLSVENTYRDIVRPRATDWRLEPAGLDSLLCLSSIYRAVRTRLIWTVFGAEGRKLRALDRTVRDEGLRQYESNLQAICDFGRQHGIRVVLCKQARLPTRALPEELRGRTTYGWIGLDHARLVSAFERLDSIIDQVAGRNGCAVIDMSSRFSGEGDVFKDHIHFTPAGSEAVAAFLAERLRPMLAR